jgi:hypothetical protein
MNIDCIWHPEMATMPIPGEAVVAQQQDGVPELQQEAFASSCVPCTENTETALLSRVTGEQQPKPSLVVARKTVSPITRVSAERRNWREDFISFSRFTATITSQIHIVIARIRKLFSI